MKKYKIVSIIISFCIICVSLGGCTATVYERRTDLSNTLYVGVVASSFPTSFMPWLSRDGIAPTIASMLYSTLFSYDDITGEYEPLLAMKWCYVDPSGESIVNEDGTPDYERLEEIYSDSKYTYLPIKITIYDNIYWSDGEKVTVEDLYYTFDVAANFALSNHAGATAWVSDLQHKYSNGVLTKQGIFTYEHGAASRGYEISEEEKDTVIYLHVNKVLGAVTSLFTSVLILPEHIWKPIVSADNQLNSKNPTEESIQAYQNPVGCGHYLLDVENSNAQQITLIRNENYHLRDENGDFLYKVEKIKFILYQEANVAIYALKKGHIDVLDSKINANYMSLFDDENIMVAKADGSYVQALVLNLNPVDSEQNEIRDLLADKDFRKAIALAIDQKELIKNVLDYAGSIYSNGLVSDSLYDIYNPDCDTLPVDMKERLDLANTIMDTYSTDFDVEGYRLYNGQRISFECLGSPGEQDVISFLQVQLQKIGVEITYKTKGSAPETTYLYNSKFDMTIQSIALTLSNADIMYNAHFVELGKTSNYGRLVDATVEQKINQMRNTLNLDEKYQLIKELQTLVADLYYKIPLYSAQVISVACTDRFTGYVVVDGSTLFNDESLKNLTLITGDGK